MILTRPTSIWEPIRELIWPSGKIKRGPSGNPAYGPTGLPTICECPAVDTSVPSSIAIVGYSNTFFTPCSACQNSAAPAWDGAMILTLNNGVLQAYNRSIADPPGTSINGKRMTPASASNAFIPVAGWCWWFFVRCGGTPPAQNDIWLGFKLGGTTALGTYTYYSGCSSGVATLDLA